MLALITFHLNVSRTITPTTLDEPSFSPFTERGNSPTHLAQSMSAIWTVANALCLVKMRRATTAAWETGESAITLSRMFEEEDKTCLQTSGDNQNIKYGLLQHLQSQNGVSTPSTRSGRLQVTHIR